MLSAPALIVQKKISKAHNANGLFYKHTLQSVVFFCLRVEYWHLIGKLLDNSKTKKLNGFNMLI